MNKKTLVELIDSIRYCSTETSDEIADKLLDDGWIKLPCKVGDKLYKVWKAGGKNYIAEFVVIAIISTIRGEYSIKYKKIGGTICHQTDISNVGKDVFLSREEIEVKLKENMK